MFPWIWIWCPRFDFPLSGNVTQDIAAEWFRSAIKPGAGDPELERAIFERVSYGKQLGILTDVLAALTQPQNLSATETASIQQSLQTLKDDITAVKQEHRQQAQDVALKQAVSTLENLIQTNRPEFDRIVQTIVSKQGAVDG